MNEGTVLLGLNAGNVLVFWRSYVKPPHESSRLSYTMEVFADEHALAEACKDDPYHYQNAEYLSVGDTWLHARSCRAFTVKVRL